jgi:hypothetical protein
MGRMGEKIVSAGAVLLILLRRFFLGWYDTEVKLEALEAADKDIRDSIIRVESLVTALAMRLSRRSDDHPFGRGCETQERDG